MVCPDLSGKGSIRQCLSAVPFISSMAAALVLHFANHLPSQDRESDSSTLSNTSPCRWSRRHSVQMFQKMFQQTVARAFCEIRTPTVHRLVKRLPNSHALWNDSVAPSQRVGSSWKLSWMAFHKHRPRGKQPDQSCYAWTIIVVAATDSQHSSSPLHQGREGHSRTSSWCHRHLRVGSGDEDTMFVVENLHDVGDTVTATPMYLLYMPLKSIFLIEWRNISDILVTIKPGMRKWSVSRPVFSHGLTLSFEIWLQTFCTCVVCSSFWWDWTNYDQIDLNSLDHFILHHWHPCLTDMKEAKVLGSSDLERSTT